jgi:photosystem II stability/assembly factor-like uncharacterized protein
MLPDAELTAVTFVSADEGWAVGDRGVIWHTRDGGKTWKLQPSGVSCRLEAVQFLDGDNGFVVGGWIEPHTHRSCGVVLRTRDGGRTWQASPELTLPGLRHVRFFDPRTGLALGDSSALYPTGVFRSLDGGRTWAPLPKGQTAGWAAGDFSSPQGGASAGWDGTLALIASQELRPARTGSLAPRTVHRLQLSSSTAGWLVGDGGLILTTLDGGLSWTAPRGVLPDFVSQFDFYALAVRDQHVWVAGSPGTCVFHSADGGASWEVLRTDQSLPLRGLWFLDEHRGWAVGALGTILHTRDGGRSWRVQRSGGTRAALLGVFSHPERIPWEVIASEAAGKGYLTAIELLVRPPQLAEGFRPQQVNWPLRVHSAVVAAGGSSSGYFWRLELPDEGLGWSPEGVLDRWNRQSDGQALARLEEHLVRRIRQWRPEVIVTEDVSPRDNPAAASLTAQLTLGAVAKAQDPAAFPNQMETLGLAPWKVKKVFSVLPDQRQGLVNLTPAEWVPRLGCTLAEQASQGRALLACDLEPPPKNIGLSLLIDRLPQESGKRDVMSGIVLQPGGEARRLLGERPQAPLAQLADAARKRHQIEQILERIGQESTVGAGWLGQISDLTRGLPSSGAAEVLWQLARRYHQTGQGERAAEVLEVLLERHPQHPLSDAAALWLVQYYASGEVAWRWRRATRFEVQLTGGEEVRNLPAAARLAGEDSRPAPAAVATVAAAGTAAPHLAPAQRAGRALGLARQVEQTRPHLYAEPALRFALASAARQSGQPRLADRLFQSLTATAATTPWFAAARSEQWLLHPQAQAPKPLVSVVPAAERPLLDGRLDDPVWRQGKPVSLTAVEGTLPDAAAVFAADDQFLYFAASCPRVGGTPPDAAGASSSQPRTTDTDLSRHDRVLVCLDVDRDYASFYSLTVDARGWPAESCFGDATWDPTWFIATGGDEHYWTVEVAIPWEELAPRRPQVREVWSVGIQRVVPGVGLQALGRPAAAEVVPEGFALLVFE